MLELVCPTASVYRIFTANQMGTSGAKFGATKIDRNLHELMSVRWGKAFTDLPSELTGPGSRFMEDFERIKMSFDGSKPRQGFQISLPAIKKGVPAADLKPDEYDPDYGDVKLSR